MTDNNSLRWQYEPGRELALYSGETVILCYHFITDRKKPFLHPVCTKDGILLTCLEPWDHVWHRGLWFSWKLLNGVNYWEELEDASQEGRTEFIASESVSLDPDRATIATRLQYSPPEGEVVLEERREITFYPLTHETNYTIDWRHTFTAKGQDVVIDRTPINEETPWGGYAGLSWRAARSLGDFHALDSEGRKDKEVEHQRARWVDLSGSSDGGRGIAAGIAMFDHPSNLRHPTHWRCIMEPGFGYINPAFVMSEPFTLSAGKSLTLFYRVLVHNGWGDPLLLEREHQEFSKLI